MTENNWLSLKARALLLVRSVAGGKVLTPKTPCPSPRAPWHCEQEPVYDAAARSIACRLLPVGLLPTFLPRTRATRLTAALPYVSSKRPAL